MGREVVTGKEQELQELGIYLRSCSCIKYRDVFLYKRFRLSFAKTLRSVVLLSENLWGNCGCLNKNKQKQKNVTHAFQSESTLYGCLNVKKLLARSRCKIWSLSDCNWTWTLNDLVLKRTVNHLANMVNLAKWLSVRLWTKWLWVWVQLQSLMLLLPLVTCLKWCG